MATKKPENGDLKKKIAQGVKAMKTSIKTDQTIEQIVDEIMKDGRTDHEVKGQAPDEKPKGLPESKKAVKRGKKIIKEEEEVEENEEDTEAHEDAESDIEGDHTEPDGDEDAEGNEPGTEDAIESDEVEDIPQEGDEEASFDVEENPEDFANDEDVSADDDIDSIISDLLKQEEIELNVDAEKGKVTITDKAEGEDKGVGAVKGDIELIGDEEIEEPVEEEEIVSDEEITEEMENDLNVAVDEEKVVKEQLDEMLKTFGKTYPKIFNEQFINKLGLIVEMYTNAKAKVQAAGKINKVVDSIDLYMEQVEANFIKENKKKLDEAADISRKEKLLTAVKTLLESKLGKTAPVKNDKKLEDAIKKLYNENKKLTESNKLLRESIFVYKTNKLFENATKGFDPQIKKSIASLLEGFDFNNTREFKSKLDAAVEVAKNMKSKSEKEVKTLRESVDKERRVLKRQRPVRRSDRTLSTETIKEAIKKRKMELIKEGEGDKGEKSDINFDEMEKYIY